MSRHRKRLHSRKQQQLCSVLPSWGCTGTNQCRCRVRHSSRGQGNRSWGGSRTQTGFRMAWTTVLRPHASVVAHRGCRRELYSSVSERPPQTPRTLSGSCYRTGRPLRHRAPIKTPRGFCGRVTGRDIRIGADARYSSRFRLYAAVTRTHTQAYKHCMIVVVGACFLAGRW